MAVLSFRRRHFTPEVVQPLDGVAFQLLQFFFAVFQVCLDANVLGRRIAFRTSLIHICYLRSTDLGLTMAQRIVYKGKRELSRRLASCCETFPAIFIQVSELQLNCSLLWILWDFPNNFHPRSSCLMLVFISTIKCYEIYKMHSSVRLHHSDKFPFPTNIFRVRIDFLEWIK